MNAFALGLSDDSDLTGRGEFAPTIVPYGSRELSPDSVQHVPLEGPEGDIPSVRLLHNWRGQWVPVVGLPTGVSSGKPIFTDAQGIARFAACGQNQTSLRLAAALANSRFTVSNSQGSYTLAASIACRGRTELYFNTDSASGQALGIWQVAHRAEEQLTQSVDMKFWDSPITFIWPASGDYYSWGQVNITRGDHWDVVGHEMGHAIYHLGNLGQFGGGQHKIDECYSETLALSEGWASFFSAWLAVDPNDPDAKFEFMVPRRAPIRFETVPEDVCRGSRNEWRVTGFFWDLYDLNADDETANESFGRLWKTMLNTQVGSARDARKKFQAAGMDPDLIDLVWRLNFAD